MKTYKTPTSSLVRVTKIAEHEMFTLYPSRLRTTSRHDFTPSSWLLPGGMRGLIDHVEEFVGPLQKVLARHTLLPLSSRFLTEEEGSVLENHFLDAPKGGVPAKVGLGGPNSEWCNVALRRCPKCIAEDLAPDGNPFWKREHLIPGILFCAKHETPLHSACHICDDFDCSADRILHPGDHCGCGLRPISTATKLNDTNVATEIDLVRVASSLLDSEYLPSFDHRGIAAVVEKASRRHGLMENGQLRPKRVMEFFEESGYRHLLKRMHLHIGPHSSIKRVLAGRTVIRNPLQNIVLLKALHGTWHAAEDEFRQLDATASASVESDDEVDAPQGASTDAHSLQSKRSHKTIWANANRERWFAHHAKAYESLKRSFPEETHTQLMDRLPPVAHVFLSKRFLLASGISPAFSVGKNEYYTSLDVSMSSHVRLRAQELHDSAHPRRISKRALLTGHKFGKAWERVEARLPLTAAALAEESEDRSKYLKRRLRELCKRNDSGGPGVFTAAQVDAFDDETVVRILKELAR